MSTASRLALSVCWGLLAPLIDAILVPAQAADYYWDINGVLSGSGGPTSNGTWNATSATLSLSPAGTLSVLPRTTTTADRLFFSAGTDATGAYTVTVSGTQNVGRLTFQEGAVSLSGGTINFGAVSGLIDGDATPDSISAVLSGANGVRFSGGTATLNGAVANTYTGTTQVGGAGLAQASLILSAPGGNAVSGNRLQMGSAGNYNSGGTVTLGAADQINDTATIAMLAGHYSGSSVFAVNGFNETIGGINLHKQGGGGSFVVVQNGAAADATVRIAGSGTYTTASGDRTFSRSIRNGGVGRLNVVVALTGTGTQTFAGTDPTYTGTTTVTSGTLRLWNTSLWASNTTLNGGILELQQTSTGTGFLTGAASRTHANTISGTAGILRKTGNGTVILSGINIYQGATSIQTGTLQAGSTSAFGSNSAVTLANVAGATLNLNGFNNSVGSLAGGGGAGGNVTLGAATLATGGDNTSTSYAGIISGSGGLTKNGTGTQTLTGANSYNGATTVAAGTLRVNGSTAASPVTANAGSTFGGNGVVGGAVTIASGAALDAGPAAGTVGTLTLSGLTMGTGSEFIYDLGEANVIGGPNNDLVQVNGNLTLGGVVNVNAPGGAFANTLLPGSYRLINYTGALAGSATIGSVPNGFAASQIQTVIPGQVNLIAVENGVSMQFWDGTDTVGDGTVDGGTSTWSNSSGNWTNAPGNINQSWIPGVGIFTGTAGVVTLAEPVSAMGLQFIADGYQVASSGAALTMVALPDASMPFVRVDAGATVDIGAPIAGSAGLMKVDAGTLVLSGTNNYTGGTTIAGGTLQLGNGGTTGNILGDVINNAALVFDRSDVLSFTGAVSGSGTVTQAGTGTTILTGANIYTGGTVIGGGTLQLGNGGTTGSILGDVTNNGALIFNRRNVQSFSGVISGSGTVTQAGTGTIIVSGTNSYAGGTFFNAGILQAAADGNLGAPSGGLTFNGGTLGLGASFDPATTRSVTLNGSGGAVDTNGFSSTMAQSISGMGGLTKAGAGILNLTGTSTYTGPTIVQAGTLAVNGSITSLTSIEAQGVLGGNGTIFDDVANAGTIAPGNSIGTLTVAGNYVGNNGRLALETVLAGDGAASDVLVLDGTNGSSATGMTTVVVSNARGNGALTVSDGIKVVNAVDGATTAPTAFTLAGDFATTNGQQAVIGGAYGYTLNRGGVSAGTDVYGDAAFTDDWYLRSDFPVSPPVPGTAPTPPWPLYQPGVPLYESYAQTLLGLNGLPTFQQRAGNRYWPGASNALVEQGDGPGVAEAAPAQAEGGKAHLDTNAIWARIDAAHTKVAPDSSTSGSRYDYNIWKLQSGVDGKLYESDSGMLIAGINAQYGKISTDVSSIYGTGSIDSDGYGLGATLTWYGDSGFYVDAQAQATWYDSDLTSDVLGSLVDGNDGFGYVLGIETGQRMSFDAHWTVTPQAQLVYSAVDFDRFTDPFGARVALDDGDSLLGRLGISADYQNAWADEGGRVQRSQLYGIANLYYQFLDGTEVDVSTTNFTSAHDRLWGGIGAGGSYSWADDKYSLYGEVSLNTSLSDFADSYSINGTTGFKVKF